MLMQREKYLTESLEDALEIFGLELSEHKAQ